MSSTQEELIPPKLPLEYAGKVGSFEYRVGKLMDTLKEWQTKAPKEYQTFIASLKLDPNAAIDQKTLSTAVKTFMASKENGKSVIEESPKDIETLIELFMPKIDVSAFNPLVFYKNRKVVVGS